MSENKIKILYITTRYTRSGPINVLKNIISNLDKNQFELYSISIYPEAENDTILPELNNFFVDHRLIQCSKKSILMGKTDAVKAYVESIQPDVIHSTGTFPDMVINRIAPQKQLIIIHANVQVDNRLEYGAFKGFVLATINMHLFRNANTAIACSESLANYYAKRGLAVPSIRNGVSVLPMVEINKTDLRKSLGLPINKRIFVYSASFIPRKNHVFLVELFKDKKDDMLLLLGDGPTMEPLRSETNAENILFAGRKTNVFDYLKASDFFVSASFQEGMPIAVLEAMSVGLPVLLSDIDQHKELFRVNEKIGECYESGNPESFRNAYSTLLSKSYSEMSDNARSTIIEAFDSKKMSAEYATAYKSIAIGK